MKCIILSNVCNRGRHHTAVHVLRNGRSQLCLYGLRNREDAYMAYVIVRKRNIIIITKPNPISCNPSTVDGNLAFKMGTNVH